MGFLYACEPWGAAASSGQEGRTGESASPSEPAPCGHRFRQADRVLRSSDFERIYKEGKRVTSAAYAIFTLANDLGRARLGLTVTRKFGNSPQRNRHKRIVREIFRKNRSAFGETLDYVVNIRTGAIHRSYKELEQDLVRAVSRLLPKAAS